MVLAKPLPLLTSQLIDQVIAPRMPGYVAGGLNEPQLVPRARQSSAALTTEPSMKVMLDARIVVPSTTRPLALAAGPKVLKASSVAGQLKRAPGYPLWSSRSGPQYRARVIHDCERRRKSNQCDEWR